jgi:hypothetical protein
MRVYALEVEVNFSRPACLGVRRPSGTRDQNKFRQLRVAVAVAVNLRPTVSRPVCPGVSRPSGTCDQFFFILEISFRQLRVCSALSDERTGL